MIRSALACAVSASALVACQHSVDWRRADAMRAVAPEPLGEARLSYKWKWVSADRRTEVSPQEFARPAVWADTVFAGSDSGQFVALRAANGGVRWSRFLGPVGTAPLIDKGLLYVGTLDGVLFCLEANTGKERWRYTSRGPIARPPVVAGESVFIANEADQVVALDALKGTFKWQYKVETPEEMVLRGHAGLAIDGDYLFTGFSNGTAVALRRDNGTVAWSASLKGEAERFFDVDSTPVVLGDTVYISSAAGGVFALEKTKGVVQWRTTLWDAAVPSESGHIGGLASDGTSLFVSAATTGHYRLDLAGNVIWRIGAANGGEPGEPVVPTSDPDLVVFTLAKDGMFLVDKQSGDVVEYFDPGNGISDAPAITGDGRLFVMSNRGVVYAFDLL